MYKAVLSVCLSICLVLASHPLVMAQSKTSSQVVRRPLPSTLKTQWPTGAWILEGVGIIMITGGIVCLGLSAGQLTLRDQLINQAKTDFGDRGRTEVQATEIQAAENNGVGLDAAGWIVGGVGMGLLVVGAVWMFSHRPVPKDPLLSSTTFKSKRIVLLKE